MITASMRPPNYSQTYPLPAGFTVRFIAKDDGSVSWKFKPRQPKPEDVPALAKAFYIAAEDFGTTIATLAGMTVFMVPLTDAQPIKAWPQVRH